MCSTYRNNHNFQPKRCIYLFPSIATCFLSSALAYLLACLFVKVVILSFNNNKNENKDKWYVVRAAPAIFFALAAKKMYSHLKHAYSSHPQEKEYQKVQLHLCNNAWVRTIQMKVVKTASFLVYLLSMLL